MKPPIYYLSCLPGVGKTRLAVKVMQKHIRTGNGYIIYVAPTLVLLKEIRKYIEADLETKHVTKIRTIVSTTHRGSSVSTKVRALLEDRDLPDGRSMRKLENGSVILMTHQGFMGLPANLAHKNKIRVIFDEARKFSAELQPVSLSSKQEALILRTLIKQHSTPLFDSSGNATPFKKFSLPAWPKELKQMTNTFNGRSQFTNLYDLISRATNKQTDVYVQQNLGKKTKVHFYEVMMPSRIFEGYKEVIIISAFLEDTQMWHLLQDQATLKPLWEHPDFHGIEKFMRKQTNKILDRFSKLCIAPLSEQSTIVSMTRLQRSILVPVDQAEEIQTKLEGLGIESIKHLLEIADGRSEVVSSKNELDAIKLLKEYKAKRDPLKWYLKQAVAFVEQLRSEYKVEGEVLAVVNESQIALLDEFPELTKIPTVSHGLNKYLNSNTLVFTAAINPKPSLIALYRALLPEYDWKRDYLADTCAQSVTRLCIRDVDSDVVAYVILPDTATADLLRSKLSDRPVISKRAIHGKGYTALTTLNPMRKSRSKLAGDKKTTKDWSADWRSKGDNRKVSSLRATLSRYRKQLREGKDVQDKIKATEAKLEALKGQAND